MKIRLAGCVMADGQGRILLLHRNTPKRTQWEIPGGKIDDNEDAEKTAEREVEEELGIKVDITKLLGDKEFTEDDFTMHYTWYAANILSGEPKVMEPNTFDKLGWFLPEELEAMRPELSPNTQNFLTELPGLGL